MWEHINSWHSLQLLGPTEVCHALGIYFTPDGNEKTLTHILVGKTMQWADRARTGYLNPAAAWLNLMMTLL